MKKAIFLFAIMTLIPLSVFAAPDRVGQWDAGINISGNFLSDDHASNAFYLGGNVSYGLKDWLGLGISIGWSDSTFDVTSSSGSTGKGGRVTCIPIFADVIFRVPNYSNKELVPYGVMGIGGIFDSIHGSGASGGYGYTTKAKDGFAFKLGAGVDWFADNNWVYNLETGYVFTDATVDVNNANGSLHNTVDLDYYYIGGGVKWLS